MVQGRSFNQALHCKHKHLLNAEMHLVETAQKFHRTPPTQGVDEGTRDELMRAQREIQALEGHSFEILNKMSDADPETKEEIRSIGDKARDLRQRIESTGVPFKADVRPRSDADSTVEEVLREVKDLQSRVDQFATSFEQEQLDEDCARCRDDLMDALDNVEAGLKEELITQDSEQSGSDKNVGQRTQKPLQQQLLSIGLLGESQMVDTSMLQSLAVGTFGAKTLEEVAGAATDNIGLLSDLRVGPLDAESVIGLGVGLGVPVLTLGTDMTRGLDSGTELALNTAALTLLANEVGDLATGIGSGSTPPGSGGESGGDGAQSVGRASVSKSSRSEPAMTASTGGGVNVGQGGEADAASSTGLVVG